MIKSISLSVSSVCNANCIFCPSDRADRIKERFMPFGLAEKVIDEAASRAFSKNHQVETVCVGENGDAFLNKELFEKELFEVLFRGEVKICR
jgi:sulfatase maturation enzyme AslB (radical SAM superfamily)